MDIQETIQFWKDCKANGTDFVEAKAMALSALQEQAEREKGCEYCNDEKSFEIHFDGEKAGIAYAAAPVFRDRKALLAETERQAARAGQAALNYQQKCRDVSELEKDNAVKDQQIATLEKELRAAVETADMWTEAEGKQREENATLKRALEIAAELYGKATGDTWHPESTVHDFIFMAEHPEKAQEQEGKK